MDIEIPHNWKPRIYQIPAWEYFQEDKPGLRGVCIWHRRAGKDLLAVNLCAKKIVDRWDKPGLYWHLLPTYKQGRKIVWNGFTRDGRAFLDHFPKELIRSKLDNEMRIHFHNGSIYQVVGTDDVGALVGSNPVGCIFSEYSLHDPSAWKYISPILLENGGWSMFITTFRGRNHGWKLYEMAKNNPKWFSDLRMAGTNGTTRHDGKPVMTDEEIDSQREAGISEEIIQQEYYCNPASGMEGSYYGAMMRRAESDGRITGVPYDPLLSVETYWDLGMDDKTVIVFAQRFGWEIRVIDCYAASGEGFPHYLSVIEKKGYRYSSHYAPHDIKVREMFGSGRSRFETARSMGLRFNITPLQEIEDGIENVRNILPRCYFDSKKCETLVTALGTYRKEPEDEKHWLDKDTPLYKNKPLHDWSSDYADAFRYMAFWCRKGFEANVKRQEKAVDDYQYI